MPKIAVEEHRNPVFDENDIRRSAQMPIVLPIPISNIIICCDGTGNEISKNISNVLKLYRCLRKTERAQPRQLVYYDPGVGTLARPNA